MQRIRRGAEYRSAAAWCGALVLVALLSCRTNAQTTQPSASNIRFESVDLYLDTADKPLAAYQLEFTTETGDATVVGIEGGDPTAFKNPPYYDPKALTRSRVIIAAFDTGTDLPTGKVRVARIHLRVAGDTKPQYAAKLITAATSDVRPLQAIVTLSPTEGEGKGARP